MKEHPVTCFCGSHGRLESNAKIYGKQYGIGYAYICERFPDCDGMVGIHPNGKPLGAMTDGKTRYWRKKLHATIDPLWKNQKDRSKRKARGSVYGWLCKITGMTPKECHVGNFDAETCQKVLALIHKNPYKYHTRLIGYEEFNGRPEF